MVLNKVLGWDLTINICDEVSVRCHPFISCICSIFLKTQTILTKMKLILLIFNSSELALVNISLGVFLEEEFICYDFFMAVAISIKFLNSTSFGGRK